MTTATAQANPNLAFIKSSDETHGRTDRKVCFEAGNDLSGSASCLGDPGKADRTRAKRE